MAYGITHRALFGRPETQAERMARLEAKFAEMIEAERKERELIRREVKNSSAILAIVGGREVHEQTEDAHEPDYEFVDADS